MTTHPAIPGRSASMGAQVRAVLALALPLIGSNLAGYAIPVTDVVLMGWYDVEALAAMTLAASLYIVILLMGMGFSSAVLPLVATAFEAGDVREARRVTRMALWLSMGFAALVMPILLGSGVVFRALGQDPGVAAQAQAYLAIAGWGLFPALVTMVLRSFLSALERTIVLLAAMIGAALLNGVFGWALIFGRWGLPEMGIEGAAWAALATNLASAAILLAYVLVRLPAYDLLGRLWRLDRAAMGRVFRLAWPISLTLLAESGLFSAAAIMVGWGGAIPLAAHGVAMQLCSITFMLHIGLSQAATIRVGQAVGRGDAVGLRRGAAAAIAVSVSFAVVTSLAFLLAPEALIALFVDPADPARPAVLAVGTTLLALAALFQLFDAAQVLALGLLRGRQDTRGPMIIAAFSYWGVGAPMAYLLGVTLAWGYAGVWSGLTLGLVCAACLLMARFWRRAPSSLAAPAAWPA